MSATGWMPVDESTRAWTPVDEKKQNLARSAQPTQFERERANAPKTTGEALKRAVGAPFTADFWSQAKEAVKGMASNFGGADFSPFAAAKMGGQIAGEDAQRQQEGRSPAYRATAAAGSMIGIPARQMEEQSDIGSPEGVVGAAAPVTAATLAPSFAERAFPIAREFVQNRVANEIGQPKPLPRLLLGESRAKALAEIAGKESPLISEGPNTKLSEGPTAPRHLANAANMEPVPVSQSPYFEQNRAKMAAEAADRQPFPLSKGPNANLFRAAVKAARENAAGGAPSPFEAPPANPKGTIVSPDSPAPPINRELTNYPREALYELAKKGDLDAIKELQRNPARYELPPNSKYLFESAVRAVKGQN